MKTKYLSHVLQVGGVTQYVVLVIVMLMQATIQTATNRMGSVTVGKITINHLEPLSAFRAIVT